MTTRILTAITYKIELSRTVEISIAGLFLSVMAYAGWSMGGTGLV